MSKKNTPKTERKVEDKFIVSSFNIKDAAFEAASMRGIKKTNKIYSKKLSVSSKSWLQRQINDPFVHKAKELGYRSRACFKINEIDDKYNLIKKASKILDLGAAPGGWTQICRDKNKTAKIIALDILDIDPVPQTDFIQGDFLEPEVKEQIKTLCSKFDLIISDIAPNTTGNFDLDHMKILSVCEDVFDFALQFLQTNGNLVMKLFMGSGEVEFVKNLKKHFTKVHYFKPSSSRKESKEIYLVCLGKKEGILAIDDLLQDANAKA
jgi:23S rRNA (uridine2552-2'-O)-methyltransferase